ncbi:hypothetical protein SERLADRAFT_446652 [Serpula lacrymans var. lacrymans S7.9]|uniref:RNase III domain-containing protein n=1 Tax=Serpula lacrymans var. lacrymans (strain S7.9) TaxID=578457 RepID=F8NMM7_SERL9|nr:uncharacterized protein SERLADRAFT_446652 [Serpula lacrymans var. lacrymans S7.9]EGO27424.1 hypothetical protein SERLADRAFT_446652 [Serpula lacrymans var. lacrymans S7.9]
MTQIRHLDPEESVYRRHFRAARHVLLQVGPCACDLLWRSVLKHHETHILPPYEEDDDADIAIATIKRAVRDLVKNWMFSMPNFDITSRSFNVTPKFAKLVQILKSCQILGSDFRGIVIVQKRAVALAIVDLLRNSDNGLGFLRPYALISTSDFYHQDETCRKFSLGTHNLLVITKSNEDLDISASSLVIKYDLFESQLSYIYAWCHTGRCHSYLVHMAEKGDETHRRILSELTSFSQENRTSIEKFKEYRGRFLLPHKLEDTIHSYDSQTEDEGEKSVSLKDPVTSNRICLRDATSTVYRLAAAMYDVEKPFDVELFRINKHLDEQGSWTYSCNVMLPAHPTLRVFTGSSCPTPADARRSACYYTCTELFNAGVLDYRLFPQQRLKPARFLEDDFEEPKKNMSNKNGQATPNHLYPRRKPAFWSNSLTAVFNDTLYPVMVALSGFSPDQYAPVLLLTRHPLPRMHDFKLFFSGISAPLHLAWGGPLEVDQNQLALLHQYTLRICRIVANKPFACPLNEMAYFYAPLKSDCTRTSSQVQSKWNIPDFSEFICWESVRIASRQWATPLNWRNVEDLANDTADAVIQDRWVEFTRRYYVVKTRPDLSPMSKPADSPREAAYPNLLEYCKSRRKGLDCLVDQEQPLIEVSKTPGLSNHLSPTFRPLTTSAKASAKYLIPELCAKLTIPASTLRTALLLPSISRRIDDILIVKELNAKFFNHHITEELLLAAISTPSAGFDYDYERLEVLGDAFLKYLSSIYVFVTNPAKNEGALHVSRQQIISNKALLKTACTVGLPPFIQSRPFSYKVWQPPNFSLVSIREDFTPNDDTKKISKAPSQSPLARKETEAIMEAPPKKIESEDSVKGKALPGSHASSKKENRGQQDTQYTQWLGDKAIADVVEAIIGAAYISGGRDLALTTAKTLDIPIRNIEHWADFGRKALTPPPRVTAKLRDGSIEAVETIIGHKFAYPHLLAQALTHASVQGYQSTCYERLEFIGDAILEFMVIRHIFNRDDKMSPGVLTLMKGAMVSNSALAAVCVWSGLHEHILYESFPLAGNIQGYIDELKKKQTEEYELAAREQRTPGQFWLDVEPPKALSDVVESIIGAIYISDGFQPIGSELVFNNILKPFYNKHITLKTLSHHPTKVILELLEAHGCQSFEIVKKEDTNQPGLTCCETANDSSTLVVIHDVILAAATDTSAAMASRRASALAIDALEGDAGFLGRTCDCRNLAQAKKGRKKAVDKILADLQDKEGKDIEASLLDSTVASLG